MKKLLLIMAIAIPVLTHAQARKPTQSTAAVGPEKPLSLQFGVGTQGIAADFRYGLFNKLALRLGGTFATYNTNTSFNFSDFKTDASGGVNLNNFHLLADYAPFAHARGFRLVGGAGYLYQGNGHLHLIPTGNYTFADYNLTGAEVGTLDMNVIWKGVAPYLGFGLFKSFPNRFFNFNLDLGTYYLTAPHTHITGTNLLVDNNQLEPQFNSNLKQYRFLPVLQFNFNFRLR